jgi:HK97 family phage prohead protease
MSKAEQRRRPQPAPQEFYTRRVELRSNSFNPATRTFSAVAATTSPVRRRGWDGTYSEVLAITPRGVRLDRLRSGRAPLLDSHRAGSVADQIGVITDARIENGQLIVDGQLSARDDDRMKQIEADLAAGIIRNVSVGYVVYASKESRGDDGQITITRTDWEPAEVSLVSIPADPNAHVRSLTEENHMPKPLPTDNNDRAIDADDEAPEATLHEKRRTMSDREVRDALRIASRARLDAAFVQERIDAGATLADIRTLAFDHMAAESARTRVSSVLGERGVFGAESLDNPNSLERAIEGVLYARMSGKPPEGAATELMGRSMLDLGAMLLQANGERVSWKSRERLASQMFERSGQSGAYHTTSDFPTLLTGAGNRVLLDAYKAAETPLKKIAQRRPANDFRAISLVKLSEAPRLLKVLEHGEVKYGALSEVKEGFKVQTFARIFGISRQALINDDLGAFADSNRVWGRAAAETEADLIVSLFTDNAGDGVKLDDGAVLYSTGRKNKAAGGTGIDVNNLGLARQALREMKGLDGATPISVTPKHLVVGAAKETEAEIMLSQIAAAQPSDANPFSGKLTLHVEPRFSGNAWRLFADPAELPTLVISYLDGFEAPQLDVREGWSTLGAEFRAVLDFGCGLSDWRGTYLNPGN